MTYSHLQIWGDSVARSILYNDQRQRYAIASLRYTTQLEKTFHLTLEDHSCMGKTAPQGLEDFRKADPVPGALCAIEYGGNDCDLNWAQVAANPQAALEAKVPLEQYRETLRNFVTAARERQMNPLLITPVPLHAQRYFAWVTRGLDGEAVLRALGDMEAIYRWQERYTLAMRQVARQADCPLLDIRDVFLAQRNYPELMCVDGIHPNEAGHHLIAEAVCRAAKEGSHFVSKEAGEGVTAQAADALTAS